MKSHNYSGISDLMGGGEDLGLPEIDITDLLGGDMPNDVEYTEDGGVIIHDGEAESKKEIPADLPFDANIAEFLEEEELSAIGSDLLDKIKADFAAGEEWRKMFNKGLKFLGYEPENKDSLFVGASGAWDSKLLEAKIRLHSEIFSELFPASGPVKSKIVGTPTQELNDRCERTQGYANFYLTKTDKPYYEDSDQMIDFAILAGSVFRTGYICPILGRPILRYVSPLKCAMPFGASGIWDSPRFTRMCDDLTKRDMALLKSTGYYLDVDVSKPTADDDDNESDVSKEDDSRDDDDETYKVYETLAYYNIEAFNENGDDVPLPYKFNIASDGTVLRIERNWDEAKAKQTGLYERKLNTTQYKFMTDLSNPFGIGLIHVLGSPIHMRTILKRQLQDSGTFANFPPTVRVKGMRMEHNNIAFKPGASHEIDTNGLPINAAIQQLNYKEPSMMLKALYDDEGQNADRLIGNVDIAIGEGRQDAPVGTTIALLEQARKPQTGVMKRLHRALTHELEILYDMFAQWLPETPYPYEVSGGQNVIMRSDFGDGINPSPVSDATMINKQERTLRSQLIFDLLQRLTPDSPPNMVEAVRRILQNMGVENIEALLPQPPQPPQPLDPLSENMLAAMQKPVQAFIHQNHDAHIAVHTPLAQGNPALQAHIQEHQAMKYRLAIENAIGMPFPADGTPMTPEVQERVAMMAAQASEAYMKQMQANMPPPPPTMEQVMLEDVKVKDKKETLRHEATLAQIDANKEIAALNADDDAAERSTRLEVAKLKSATDLKIADDKLQIQPKNF